MPFPTPTCSKHPGAMTPNRARFKGRFTSPAPASASSAAPAFGVTGLLALIAPAAASASQVATGWPAATSASLKTSVFFFKMTRVRICWCCVFWVVSYLEGVVNGYSSQVWWFLRSIQQLCYCNNPVQIEDLESSWLHSTSIYRDRGKWM